MDAAFFRLPAAALGFALVGCAGTDAATSKTDVGFFQARSQAPIVPAGPAPIEPLNGPAPAYSPPADRTAPVAPPSVLPASPATPTIVPVAGSSATTTAPVPAGDPQVRVVAVIGTDVVITDEEVWQQVRQRLGEYIKLNGTERDAKEKEIFRQELRRLIDRELILNDFFGKVRKNKPGALDEIREDAERQASQQIKGIRKANNFTTEDEFTQAMKANGISIKGMRRQFERGAMMNMYLGQFIREKIKAITVAEIQAYYNSHPDEFRVEDRVKWQDLFVSYARFASVDDARKFMANLQKQAKGGADVAELAKQHADGTSKILEGEGVGTKRGEIKPPELEATIFQLKAGDVSEIVATERGLHVVKVVERDVAGVAPLDDKTQQKVRLKVAEQIEKTERERLIEDLWRKTTVRIMDLP